MRDVHIGMGDGHEIVPQRRCEMTAGIAAAHRLVIIVAKPDAGYIFAGEADKPSILWAGAGSGFAS